MQVGFALAAPAVTALPPGLQSRQPCRCALAARTHASSKAVMHNLEPGVRCCPCRHAAAHATAPGRSFVTASEAPCPPLGWLRWPSRQASHLRQPPWPPRLGLVTAAALLGQTEVRLRSPLCTSKRLVQSERCTSRRLLDLTRLVRRSPLSRRHTFSVWRSDMCTACTTLSPHISAQHALLCGPRWAGA